jgi:hypothetical protein
MYDTAHEHNQTKQPVPLGVQSPRGTSLFPYQFAN